MILSIRTRLSAFSIDTTALSPVIDMAQKPDASIVAVSEDLRSLVYVYFSVPSGFDTVSTSPGRIRRSVKCSFT